jgi:hypothetical protein
MRTIVESKDLQLGDIITPHDSINPFDSCIVKQITDAGITLFRPYAVTERFTYTGGVICYTGTEQYTIYKDDRKWILHIRQNLL